MTTNALAGIIDELISAYPDLQGVLQVASRPISKYDLLVHINRVYDLQIEIVPEEMVVNNRSLDAGKFRKETKIKIPSWEYMIEEMYRDPTPYSALRGHHVQ
jgi:dTDP-4-dehydrorhamnose reductase